MSTLRSYAGLNPTRISVCDSCGAEQTLIGMPGYGEMLAETPLPDVYVPEGWSADGNTCAACVELQHLRAENARLTAEVERLTLALAEANVVPF